MMLPILKYGAPPLRTMSKPIEKFAPDLEEIAKNMFETMYGSPGIGLAAPQIGINIRLVIIDLTVGEDENGKIIICNPEIVSSEGEQKNDEGCLSIPDFSDTVTRPLRMIIRGQSLHGDEVRYEAEGLLARCFSHEIDHLNGVLFIDRLSPLKRSLIRNKIKKLTKSGEW
jgi:peptide deformylase